MARRLAAAGIRPDLIVASPAVRTQMTARFMAEATGYDEAAIHYDKDLYLGSFEEYCQVIAVYLDEVDVLFVVGHNNTITELAVHLCGQNLGNVPTCGVVALDYSQEGKFIEASGRGKLMFFWFPKDQGNYGN